MTTSRTFPSHELQQHTSEIEIQLQAGSLADLLAEAGKALAEVQLAEADGAFSGAARPIQIASSDREALLVDWLNELIYLADVDRWVALDFEFDLAQDTEVRARAAGVILDWAPSRAKAATMHGLTVRNIPGGLEARVVIDV